MTGASDKRTQDRHAIILGLRVGGAVQAAIGLWMLLGGSFFGHYGFGAILFVNGVIDLVAVPAWLLRRWKTKP